MEKIAHFRPWRNHSHNTCKHTRKNKINTNKQPIKYQTIIEQTETTYLPGNKYISGKETTQKHILTFTNTYPGWTVFTYLDLEQTCREKEKETKQHTIKTGFRRGQENLHEGPHKITQYGASPYHA